MSYRSEWIVEPEEYFEPGYGEEEEEDYGYGRKRGGCGFWCWVIIVLIILFILWLLWMRHQKAKQQMPLQPNQFRINIAPKSDPNNPCSRADGASRNSFTINDIEAGTIHVKRGQEYQFIYGGNSMSPSFYFTTSAIGGMKGKDSGALPYGKVVSKSGDFKVTFGPEFPDIFYYQSSTHKCMGGQVMLR